MEPFPKKPTTTPNSDEAEHTNAQETPAQFCMNNPHVFRAIQHAVSIQNTLYDQNPMDNPSVILVIIPQTPSTRSSSSNATPTPAASRTSRRSSLRTPNGSVRASRNVTITTPSPSRSARSARTVEREEVTPLRPPTHREVEAASGTARKKPDLSISKDALARGGKKIAIVVQACLLSYFRDRIGRRVPDPLLFDYYAFMRYALPVMEREAKRTDSGVRGCIRNAISRQKDEPCGYLRFSPTLEGYEFKIEKLDEKESKE